MRTSEILPFAEAMGRMCQSFAVGLSIDNLLGHKPTGKDLENRQIVESQLVLMRVGARELACLTVEIAGKAALDYEVSARNRLKAKVSA